MAKHDIPKTAELMNLTPAYVRALIRKGSLVTEMEPIVPDSLVKRHMVSDEEMARFQADFGRRVRRTDKRNKYVIYMTPGERVKVVGLLEANELQDIVSTIRSWNPLKPPRAKDTPKPKPKSKSKASKPKDPTRLPMPSKEEREGRAPF